MKPFCSIISQKLITGTIGLILLGSLYFYTLPFYFSLIMIAASLWIVSQELPQLASPTGPLFWVLVSFYIALPVSLMIALNQSSTGRPLLLFTFLLCFSHDAAANFVGAVFGNHRLAPTVSPNKTWEGCIGGFFGVATLIYFFTGQSGILTLFPLIGIALVISFLSVTGDLFESFLKRRVKLKDTGGLLPGHGGILDRIDSIIFVVPFIYTIQKFLTPIIGLNN